MKSKETLEEVAREYYKRGQLGFEKAADTEMAFLRGANWQKEQMYSEEEVRNAIDYGAELGLSEGIGNSFEWKKKKDLWFEQFKNK